MAKNGNGWDGGQQDYLAAYVKLYGSGGNEIANYDYSSATNKLYNWTNFNFSETFASPYIASTLSTAQVGFVGRDNNFWAGNYGPEVYNVSFNLKYKVDPCTTNPAYSSTCAGFSSILNTNNLLDSTKGGTSLNQAFAINTALQSAGVGATVHGFNYGFNWRVGQGFSGCTAWNQDGSCSWTMNIPAYANATFSLTNSNNQSIHSKPYSFTGEGTSGSVSEKFLLPSSMNQSLLGTGRIVGSASGTGSSIEGAWATMIYTVDPCIANPLYSSNCKGYAFAMAKQLSASNNTSLVGSDGTQMQDPVQDPTRLLLSPSSPSPGSEPPPSATQTASSNTAGSTAASQPPSQGGSTQQTKAGEVTIAGDNKNSSSSSVSLSSIMNMISSNQARIGNEARSVVQAAESAAAQSATSAQEQAESIANAAVMQSTSSSTMGTSVSSGNAVSSTQSQASAFSLSAGQTSTATSTEMIRPPIQVTTTETSQSSGTGLSVSSMAPQFTSPSSQFTSVLSTVESPLTNFGFQLQSGRASTQVEPESIPQFEGIKIGGRSALNDIIEQRPMLQGTTTQEQRTDAVNKNAQPNELAGRVDIASMATQPVGYQAYSMIIPDVAFYAPREIYRNQVNVDNARLLRGLGSDRLHQEMVNQQYRPRN
jgi:hypothetical protein